MSHDVRLIRAQDFVQSDVNGVVDLQGTMRLLRETAAACLAHENHHVLIDVREARGKFTAPEVVELALTLRDLGFDRHHRIAILNDPRDGFDRAALFETVAATRGFYVRAFREFEDAFRWLMSSLEAS